MQPCKSGDNGQSRDCREASKHLPAVFSCSNPDGSDKVAMTIVMRVANALSVTKANRAKPLIAMAVVFYW
ncbi:MAG: hypothetical protein A3H35_00565 [Betaproteobacteria bacterium RIFCSPLOWO2_02_FULL_62_17]|nr:MAG: hypothetical protein A3H35_00565 [Betaproteobacteria bacterium RIFCSPLOWO2_02_FULL_62_17]